MVLPSGIERSSYAPDAHKTGLVFLGRLAHHKHPEMIIAAVDELLQNGYTIPLTIAGDGPLLEQIAVLARNRSDIRVLGRVSESKKRSLLASSWLHVLPSEREGFPRTIAEAMASGTPTLTVSSPDNGGQTIVDEYQCGLVTEPTPAALASSITTLLTHSSHWHELSMAGLRNSDRLDWRALSGQFLAFLEAEGRCR
jgi:glycosyltransferase involved in cell wall biosynthesis